MLIVDAQIHLWAKGTPSAHHREEPYSAGSGYLSKRLAGSVALVGEQAPAASTRATMKCEAGIGCRGGLLGQPLPPQLLHAGTDCLEIVSCSRP